MHGLGGPPLHNNDSIASMTDAWWLGHIRHGIANLLQQNKESLGNHPTFSTVHGMRVILHVAMGDQA
jgi:hypothetical protein